MTGAGVALRWVGHGTPEYERLVDLRREILRKPLGLVFTPEQLAAESDQLHLGAWDGERALGCLVLRIASADSVVMRQVAVAAEAQRRGIGKLLVDESEREARRRGLARMSLHARETAVPFYERLGYHIEGEPFTEVGLPHREMAKTL
ncbi:MAG: GNAT family N-acetyltransferase [Elusimicrobia bacterium]|nr:GNAT family N-acetyltransferase [Elusimicrobiota bacterium]